MELKLFVKNALLELISAIEEVGKESEREVHLAKPQDNKCIMFDIAVTVENSIKGNVKGSTEGIIKVLGASIAGDVGGELRSGNVSRVSFGVYVDSETNQQKNERRKRDVIT